MKARATCGLSLRRCWSKGICGGTGGSWTEKKEMGASTLETQRTPVFSTSGGPTSVSGCVTKRSAPRVASASAS
jgi:hypothetical protein